MLKLYETHPYQTTCTAEILSIIEKDNQYHIVLDQTIFFPGTDTFPCDKGWIEDSEIIDAYHKDDLIYHVTLKKPIKIHKVSCRIDWNSRLDAMQHHTLSQLLSARLLEKYQARTTLFRFTPTQAMIEINSTLSADALDDLHTVITTDILDNHAITITYPTKKELKKRNLKPTSPHTPARLMCIDTIDSCLSEIPALQGTLELTVFEWLSAEKIKTGMRLYFACGRRAITHLQQSAHTHTSTVASLQQTIRSLEGQLRESAQRLLDYEAQEYLRLAPVHHGVKLVTHTFEDFTPKRLLAFANQLIGEEKVVALLSCTDASSCHFVFICSSNLAFLKMHTLLKDSITLVDGHGGGTPTLAQGGGKSTHNLDSMIDYALMKIKAQLQ